MAKKVTWPKTVPVLTGSSFKKHPSLSVWCKQVFVGVASEQALIAIINELLLMQRKQIRRWVTVSVAEYARVWNCAMATLGYVFGNPEAKRKRK